MINFNAIIKKREEFLRHRKYLICAEGSLLMRADSGLYPTTVSVDDEIASEIKDTIIKFHQDRIDEIKEWLAENGIELEES